MPSFRLSAPRAYAIAIVSTLVVSVVAGTSVWMWHSGRIALFTSVRAQPLQESLAPIFTESDISSTEFILSMEASSSLPLPSVVIPPTATTINDGLMQPALAYLKRVTGDPKLPHDEVHIQVPVFMYHHIRPLRVNDTSRERYYTVTPEIFEAQLKGLVEQGYQFIPPTDLQIALDQGQASLPAKPVLLTFDDGLREHYTTVFPLLKKYHAKATYFVITGANRLSGYLTNDMIKELDGSGVVTIASHTKQHPFLAHISLEKRREEIKGSKVALETLLGHPVTAFAYPYGDVNASVYKEVEDAGYKLGFGVRLGSLHGESSRFQLRRIRVQQGERLSDLADAFSQK